MKRGFKIVSLKIFEKETKEGILYDKIKLPVRKTEKSAAYDFILYKKIEIKPNQILKIATGVKAYMQNDEVLLLAVRSSTGFRYNIRLCNQIGIIDADYYNNEENEGHIWLAIQNEGDKTVVFEEGQALVQGLFINYLKSDDEIKVNRKGGLGSTDRRNTDD